MKTENSSSESDIGPIDDPSFDPSNDTTHQLILNSISYPISDPDTLKRGSQKEQASL